MEKRTLNEWFKWYKQRTGDKELEIYPNEIVDYHPEHGFIIYAIDKDAGILASHYTCGDGKYWARVYVDIMKLYGLQKFEGYTERNPEAWIRKYGGHIKGYYMEADINEIKV